MSGAAVLTLLAWHDPRVVMPTVKDGPGVIALFAYVATFTPAYVRLDAATGALILFASVQIILVVVSFVKACHSHLQILPATPSLLPGA
jgi:hypothetical protein